MSIWKWASYLAPVPPEAQITLGEGDTPLIHSRHIGPAVGLNHLYFKLEMFSPSGSFKDRFAVVAVSDMLARGKTRCVATSSGNAGAALAGYCAAAGIRCEIALVEAAPLSKLRQIMAYRASLYRVRGFGSDEAISWRTFCLLQEMGCKPDAAVQISAYYFSPVGMTGVQTISYELAEQLNGRVDHVFVPAGGGGSLLAIARGFEELVRRNGSQAGARVHCVQPAGNNTIAGPLRSGAAEATPVQSTTRISGLQVPNIYDGSHALQACRRSRGTGHVVADEQVWAAQAMLAREEGIFTEPAGAVALSGILQARTAGELDPEAVVVCMVTGSGFKDTLSLENMTADIACPTIDVAELAERAGVPAAGANGSSADAHGESVR